MWRVCNYASSNQCWHPIKSVISYGSLIKTGWHISKTEIKLKKGAEKLKSETIAEKQTWGKNSQNSTLIVQCWWTLFRKHSLAAVPIERNAYAVRTVWEAVTALAWIPINMFLACGLSWLPVKIPPHNSPGTYFLPNLVQMWCVQEASCDFPCCSGYFYSTEERSVPNPLPIPSNSLRKSVIHTRMFSPALSCIATLRFPSLALFPSRRHTHQSSGSAMTKGDAESQVTDIWPLAAAQSYMEKVVMVKGGSWGRRWKTERAARRTEVPRAGNTGRVKPLEWSLHQSGQCTVYQKDLMLIV